MKLLSGMNLLNEIDRQIEQEFVLPFIIKANQENEKDVYIHINVEPSLYEVFVAAFFMKDDEPLTVIRFETDRNTLDAFIEFSKSTSIMDDAHIFKTHRRLAEIIANEEEIDVVNLSAIILNFLTCFVDSEDVCNVFPDQSIGFFLKFDMDDFESCILNGAPKLYVESEFNIMFRDQIQN